MAIDYFPRAKGKVADVQSLRLPQPPVLRLRGTPCKPSVIATEKPIGTMPKKRKIPTSHRRVSFRSCCVNTSPIQLDADPDAKIRNLVRLRFR